ncbi:ATP-binding protein [Bacillus sp. BHET2]|uniref:ATP-binding protein n=1 Tax=Bacillus sp. BHET2 TaxID=2583818 RepID=UPI00110D9649|nr:ATP-binding protein [Bacillus sp. BHET2]TMU85246.1 ATP-binding protein [Bacillus sp. BHET2]
MTRLIIMTVGKTHSGKTTFAMKLAKQLENSVVIDQDNHAEFINTYYKNIVPVKGPNILKYAISQTMVDFAIHETSKHIILCNSNLSRNGRSERLEQFQQSGFHTILVHCDIPDSVLQARVANSERSKAIFRSAVTFEEVLKRQQSSSYFQDVAAPVEGEADHLVVIHNEDDVEGVIQEIVGISF